MSDWMFEVAAAMPTGVDDPILMSTGATVWQMDPSPRADGDASAINDGKSVLTEFDIMPLGSASDEDWTSIDDIVVNRNNTPNPGAPSDWYDFDGYDSNEEPWQPDYTWEELTDCITIVGGFETPDGAVYVVPEGIDAEYVNNAIAYLHSLLPAQKEAAFYQMYTDRNHPHFLDFKEIYEGLAYQTYYSDVLGEERTTSAFEPFGNFLYGFVGVLGGIDPAVLRVAAALMQEGDSSGGDAPEDVPHVNFGIERALHYLVVPHDVVTISSCGD